MRIWSFDVTDIVIINRERFLMMLIKKFLEGPSLGWIKEVWDSSFYYAAVKCYFLE